MIARQVDAGQTVAASFAAPKLFQIAQDLSKMQVDADIDESEVAKVHVGQIAQFTVDAMPTRTFEAVVRQVRESATNVQNVITYDAVMDVPNPDLVLLPGMTANIRIPVQVRENVLRVPNSALRYKPVDDKAGPPSRRPKTQQARRAQTVYVLNSAGKPEPRKIQVGLSDGLYTEVVSGDLHRRRSRRLAGSEGQSRLLRFRHELLQQLRRALMHILAAAVEPAAAAREPSAASSGVLPCLSFALRFAPWSARNCTTLS